MAKQTAHNSGTIAIAKKKRFAAILICLFICLATAAVYWQVKDFSFVNYDDNFCVPENYHVQGGLSLENIFWAFTDATEVTNYWAPLTWLSFILEYEFHGMDSGRYHITNVLFHMANTILLFLFLRRATGSLWRSGFAAALFALHPLHVESVAWVTERKDVLSTLFWMLTLLCYVAYAENPGTKWYIIVLLSFFMGLIAKPMLVTLPFVLLLLDFWPLSRSKFGRTEKANSGEKASVRYLVLEKISFFFIILIFCVVTFITQQKGGAVKTLEEFPINLRIANVLVSYIAYIGKMIWPNNLAAIYPHPESLPLWQAAGSGLLLLFISILAVKILRNYPYFLVGWLWYIGTLVPVIGLVVIGPHGMADRYTYVPLVGLFIIVAWGIPDLVARWRYRKYFFIISSCLILFILSMLTFIQISYWKNSFSLFNRALEVTDNNHRAYCGMGIELVNQGKLADAIAHYKESIRIKPDYALTHNNLGVAYKKIGETKTAIYHINEALKIQPDYPKAHNNLGLIMMEQGNLAKAIWHFQKSIEIEALNPKAHCYLAAVLMEQGNISEAVSHLHKALNIKPDYADAHLNLAKAFIKQNKSALAISHLEKALGDRPDDMEILYTLGVTLVRLGMSGEAVPHFQRISKLKPDAEAHNNLGVALLNFGNVKEAIHHFSEALRLDPSYETAVDNLKFAIRKLKDADNLKKLK